MLLSRTAVPAADQPPRSPSERPSLIATAIRDALPRRLHAGDLVEVRSKEEILRTLDANGRLDELPFMPEMLEYCGKTLRVGKRAHKTCDPAVGIGGRKMPNTVHLENIRCNGAAHDGCEAGCLIFWKDAWLEPLDRAASRCTWSKHLPRGTDAPMHGGCALDQHQDSADGPAKPNPPMSARTRRSSLRRNR